MIKKFKIEFTIFIILILNFSFSNNIDLIIYNKITNGIFFTNNFYFKKFFINITEIGDSFWVFLFSITIYCFCYIFKNKITENNKDVYNNIKIGSLFLFVATFITGFLTQIIKHIAGRLRPNHYQLEKNIEFDFFNLDSAFHSFPSGHTSTIFIVVLVFSTFTPKIKYFYFFFGTLVALSRIVVGAHYFTDIIGGVVIAFVGFKITKIIFKKFGAETKPSLINVLNSNILLLCLIIFIISIIFITLGPTIDVHISNLFYVNQNQFILQSYYLATVIIRKIILPFLVLYLSVFPILSLFLPIKKIFFNINFKKTEVFFIFFSTLFNLLFVINFLLKNNWGRARPNDIFEFGGKENFTPWFKISDSCISNCSFVSGDASVGFSIIVLFVVTKNKVFLWLALFFGSLFGLVRILEGGHFLSDVIIAGFLVFFLCYIQYYFFQKNYIKNAN